MAHEPAGRWVAYVAASDWQGPVEGSRAEDWNGWDVSNEIEQRLANYLPTSDAPTVTLDPEGDGIGISAQRADPIVALIRGLRKDGFLFGSPSDTDSDIVTFSADTDAQVLEDAPPGPDQLPGPIMGPYRWPDGKHLRGFFSTRSRIDWHGRSATDLLPELRRALAEHGLDATLQLRPDGPEDFALVGPTEEAFQQAAVVLGLDGTHQGDG